MCGAIVGVAPLALRELALRSLMFDIDKFWFAINDVSVFPTLPLVFPKGASVRSIDIVLATSFFLMVSVWR